MKRKTNLFYNIGPDSKFLTFSNYTEALTGNFLSTNTKLFPSTFICLYIPSLDNITASEYDNKKKQLINSLMGYYENKLASCRDLKKPNDVLYPLSYLLKTILDFDPKTKGVYIGNITEQDYNGTYTDTICTIDSSALTKCNITLIEDRDESIIECEDTLYGWYEKTENGNKYIGPSVYGPGDNEILPVFDFNEPISYNINAEYKITYNKYEGLVESNIIFNVVIPMFSLLNTGDEPDIIINEIEKELISTETINCPLGIWFSRKNVELYHDGNYGQSWSLAIGSQFKPLPMSDRIQSDITKNSNKDAYMTFAQVLTRQNQLVDKFSALSSEIIVLNKKIQSLEMQIASLINNSQVLLPDSDLSRAIKETVEDRTNIINQSTIKF